MHPSRTLYLELVTPTPLGPIAVAASERGLVGVEIGVTDLEDWANRFRKPEVEIRFEPGPFPIAVQLTEYLAGKRDEFDLPVDLSGTTSFQAAVLSAVRLIPRGQTRTYGQLAAQIGRRGAARAVGRANATNPIPLVIPCHRLVGADGSLRGYGAPDGVETKAWLLELEGSEGV